MSSSAVAEPAQTTGSSKPVDRQPPNPAAPEPPAAAGRPKAQLVFVGLLALAGLIAGVLWLLGRGKQTTDDAQVEGRVVSVSAQVSGKVARVLVRDNQLVKAGDILVEIERDELEARLAAAVAETAGARAQLDSAENQLVVTQVNSAASLRQAKGGLTQASSTVNASRSGLEQAKADVQSAEASARLADTDLKRAQELRAEGTIPQAELDLRIARYDQAQAQLDQARARLSSTEANLEASGGGVEVATGRLSQAQTAPQQIKAARAARDAAAARVKLAEAQQRLAELNVERLEVRAPVAGLVSRRSVEQGQLVDPGRPMLALVPLDDIWVVANYKEDQIGRMRPGQRARIHVDTYGIDLEGKVDSLAGAAGARFALLPPDNASGNFIKVVQRVPVLIRFEQLPKEQTLRPGLSVEATVFTE